jgi:hypothetical protein
MLELRLTLSELVASIIPTYPSLDLLNLNTLFLKDLSQLCGVDLVAIRNFKLLRRLNSSKNPLKMD